MPPLLAACWACCLHPLTSFLRCCCYWLPARHVSSAALAAADVCQFFLSTPCSPRTFCAISARCRTRWWHSTRCTCGQRRCGVLPCPAAAAAAAAFCPPKAFFWCNKSWGACPLLPPANCPAFPIVLVRKAGVACRCPALPIVLIRKAGLLRCRRCPAFPIVLIGRLPRPLFSVTITSSHTQLPWHVVFGPKNAAGRSGSCRAASAVPAFTHSPCAASLPPLQSEGRHYGEASCRDYRLSVLAALPHRCGVSSRPPAFCQCRTGDCVLSAAPVNVLRSVMQQSCQFVIDSAPCCVAAVALYSCRHVQP